MLAKAEKDYFLEAAKQAQKSLCLKRRCGTVIVSRGLVIGAGYNAPPGDDTNQRRCSAFINKHAKRPTDKTCCIHAEQRAMFNALKINPGKLNNSVIYFASVDKDSKLEYAGKPYCTHCSKMALDLKIAKFGLWHRSGPKLYDTLLYNELSYNYNRRK